LWVIVALVSLIVLIILILCIPLALVFQVNTSKSPVFQIRLLWLFGLIDRDLKKAKKEEPEKEEKITRGEPKPKRRISASTVYQILRTRGLFTHLRRLLVSVFKSLKIKELAANIKLGLENPADTALLFALLGPLYFLLNKLPYEINVLPSFDGDITLEAYLHGVIRLWPILVVLALLRFVFSVPAIRISKTLILKR
jgi:hypothetical protein